MLFGRPISPEFGEINVWFLGCAFLGRPLTSLPAIAGKEHLEHHPVVIRFLVCVFFWRGGGGMHVRHPLSSPERTRSKPNQVSASLGPTPDLVQRGIRP